MSNLSTEGKLKRIHEEQIINERFKKREFVIETEEQYSQTLIFQLVQDKTNIIDNFKIGDKIEVYFNLRGREWQRDTDSEIRVFNTTLVNCKNYYTSSLPRQISDSEGAFPGVTNVTVNVFDQALIEDINVKVSIEHNYIEDISIYLIAPNQSIIK